VGYSILPDPSSALDFSFVSREMIEEFASDFIILVVSPTTEDAVFFCFFESRLLFNNFCNTFGRRKEKDRWLLLVEKTLLVTDAMLRSLMGEPGGGGSRDIASFTFSIGKTMGESFDSFGFNGRIRTTTRTLDFPPMIFLDGLPFVNNRLDADGIGLF
jgi:hypothetical protein